MPEPSMPGKARRRGGCLRNGLLGCLAVAVLAVVVPLSWVFIEMARGVPDLSPEKGEWSQALPPAAGGQDPMTGAPAGGVLPMAAGGRVILDFSMGELEIVPGEPGQPIRLEADYDSGSFELREDYQAEGELGWTYRLEFRSKVSWIRRLFAGSQGENNRIRLILPRDTPMALAGSIGVGESHLELGGLWLTDVALDIGVGDHAVSFSDPTAVPLPSLRLSASVGELDVDRIGNASPRRTVLEHSIGEARFDLRGRWLGDGEVDVSCGIGECSVRLPGRDVRVELERASVTIGEQRAPDPARLAEAPEGAPTVRVRVSGTLGELTVDD